MASTRYVSLRKHKMIIIPTYITFEQAKWLKEKKFDIPVRTIFKDNGDLEEAIGVPYNYNIFENIQSTPEQWQVVEWLFKEHNIYIHINPSGDDGTSFKECKWNFSIYKNILENFIAGSKITPNIQDFNSIEETYSAVFDYIKQNNLI